MPEFVITAEIRKEFGKGAAKKIRRTGKLPAILYGNKEDNIPLIVNKMDIQKILKSDTGENTLFTTTVDSKTFEVMIKDFQKDPVHHEIVHVDLYRIALDKPIEISVPLVLIGEAVGVKSEGGFIDFVTREIEVKCLPKNIPENIEMDITPLHINQSLKVEDISVPEKFEILTEKETVIVHIEAPAVEEEEFEEKEETLFAEEPEQPEVVRKEKPAEKKKEEEEDKVQEKEEE